MPAALYPAETQPATVAAGAPGSHPAFFRLRKLETWLTMVDTLRAETSNLLLAGRSQDAYGKSRLLEQTTKAMHMEAYDLLSAVGEASRVSVAAGEGEPK